MSFAPNCTVLWQGVDGPLLKGGRPATKQANNKKKRRWVAPIAVVVNLIRPNRGLAVVLLGKSTTTKKMGSRDFRAP